jgi:DNA-binding transcriptional regulator YiaG
MATPHKTKNKRSKSKKTTSKGNAAVNTTSGKNRVLELREKIGLKQNEFAKLANISVRSLASFEKGQALSDSALRKFRETQRLIQALSEVIQVNSLKNWLLTPNPAFEDYKPLEIIVRGEVDRIWAMIYFLRSGDPS